MKINKILFALLLSSLILAACAPYVSTTPGIPTEPEGSINPPEENTPTSDPNPTASQPDEEAPVETSPPDQNNPPSGAEREFSTDFSISSVDFNDILSGGPPKDGIPPIDDPKFISISEADEWIDAVEPVIQLTVNGEAKAYPLQILTWHEIVNDTIGGVSVVVSFCPLCNTAIAFERTVNGELLDFGATGRLRFSNLIMYDRQTETWWQQATGEAIVGELTGTQLEFLPAALISWDEFKKSNPDSLVLSRETGFTRSYGRNPYIGYDDINEPPFLYFGPDTPDDLSPTARVLSLEINNDSVAYPYSLLSEMNVINDAVGDEAVAIFWEAGTASALDAPTISEGQDVGSAVAYSRTLEDNTLTFSFDGEKIIDNETGSTWNIQGRAIDGPSSGEQLTEVVSVNHFWFSWAAFKPNTRIYKPEP